MLRQQHDTAERRKRFLSSFLYFTKRRTKCRLRRRKDLIGLCENVFLVHCSEVCKTSELPGKVLIVAVRSCGYSVLLRGLQNLETPCKGERIVTFCIVQKVTKKHVLGRTKSCRWQVFVRRRPPKQGELRTDVSKATMFQGDGAAKKAHGVCCPEWGAFLSYFLCLTKSRSCREAAKDLIGLVRSCSFVR